MPSNKKADESLQAREKKMKEILITHLLSASWNIRVSEYFR